MYFLRPEDEFPPVEMADDEGLLAVTSFLDTERIRSAYKNGIFPWYNEGQPVLWWSPNPRMVLFPEELKISKSMRPYINQQKYKVTFNQDFEAVIEACAEVTREGQDGTWITPDIKQNYTSLFKEGFVHSVEVWDELELVGGLYGVYLRDKKVFCGESMFSKKSNASKFGFIELVQKLQEEGVKVIDCQIYTRHLESLGAREIPREEFLEFLR